MFHITVDHKSKTAMYLQIYEYIAKEIKQGQLPCHSKLPSGRALAQDLNISRNTVNMAYAQLESEGYIEAKPKQGYFVKEMDGILDMGVPEYDERIQTGVQEKKQYLIDFSPFGIDLNYVPYHRWKKLMKETMLDTNAALFQNGDSQGDLALRAAIREYLHRARGVNCTEKQIIIGAGTDYLLMLLTRILPEYESVAMENPVYQQAYRVFDNFKYQVYPVPLDEEGMNIERLKETDASLAFVTPSHQFPTGSVMPINRRMQLLNWAYKKKERYIIEDDYDSEFRYQGKPIPSLQGIDTKGKVIYLGTLSKAISPSIRIGYMVLPESLCDCYNQYASFYATTVSRIDQEIVRRFIMEGYFERHLNRMRGIYRGKHDFILNTITHWKQKVIVKGHSSGLHVLLEFHDNRYTEKVLVERAKAADIKVYPLSSYYIDGTPEWPTVLLGYANLSEAEIASGLQILETVWSM